MERSIELSEKYGDFSVVVPDDIQRGRTTDAWQRVFNSYIKSPFFLWVVLILLMNRKNWKRPIMLLLIVHWLFRSTGDMLNKSMDISPGFTPKNMYVGAAIANVFWCVGEIIGDWYPLLRTKAIVNNKNKVRVVFVTCGIYNFTKIVEIAFYFIEVPLLLYSKDPNVYTEYNLRWWTVVAAIQTASFMYDLSVILCLKHNLFNQLKYYKSSVKNTFVERFKRISEFRILLSMSVTLMFLPLILVFIFFIFRSIKNNDSTPLATDNIELMRRAIIDINFNLIYIDQILLRCYVDNDKARKTMNSSSNTKISENKTYRELSSFNNNYTATMSTTNTMNDLSKSNSNTYVSNLSKDNSSNSYFESLSKMNNNNYNEASSGMNHNIINIESLPPTHTNKYNNYYKPIINNKTINANYEPFSYNSNNQNDKTVYARNHGRNPSDIKMYDYY
ncbi:hypothetical protein PIROE2DRAFT_1422 [Piromyces sp. E2]|nr:hypothetical protein PIROE2DRAFT_1422 [Piromyces sp. E2]|eukprot:OUM70537.1 hypothetical protein PIROE2DRAFT_1422 [Piromyces sp. E2]